jgi:hypothetical protein
MPTQHDKKASFSADGGEWCQVFVLNSTVDTKCIQGSRRFSAFQANPPDLPNPKTSKRPLQVCVGQEFIQAFWKDDAICSICSRCALFSSLSRGRARFASSSSTWKPLLKSKEPDRREASP